jgi:hypothetical protein
MTQSILDSMGVFLPHEFLANRPAPGKTHGQDPARPPLPSLPSSGSWLDDDADGGPAAAKKKIEAAPRPLCQKCLLATRTARRPAQLRRAAGDRWPAGRLGLARFFDSFSWLWSSQRLPSLPSCSVSVSGRARRAGRGGEQDLRSMNHHVPRWTAMDGGYPVPREHWAGRCPHHGEATWDFKMPLVVDLQLHSPYIQSRSPLLWFNLP